MRRWLAVVIPPRVLLGAATLYGLAVAVMFVYWRAVTGDWPGEEVRSFLQSYLLILAALYGGYRVGRFHPHYRPAYRDWLATTPWRSPQPLPHGPVQLAPQDLLIVGAMAGVSWWLGGPAALYVPHAFLAAYLVVLGLSLMTTGPHWADYVIGIGLGGMLLLWEQVWACLGLALAITIAATVGLRQALAAFPWDQERAQELNRFGAMRRDMELGWPFSRLGPGDWPSGLGWRDAILISLLAGWTNYVIARTFWDRDSAIAAAATICMILACARLVVYMLGCAAPISLLGRLVTRRLVIPAYDGVFAAPLLALWAGVGVPIVLLSFGIAPEVAGPAALTLGVFLTLKVGPSLRQWRLAGGQRLTPPAASKAMTKTG